MNPEYVYRVSSLLTCGMPIGPRGFATREQIGSQLFLASSHHNLLDLPERHLNFKYAVAEWLWIQFGHSDVATIAQYNTQLHFYSDDGVFFKGAYGPHVNGQWKRCLGKLQRDSASRQAVLEIPRPTAETKDEPCTLSLQFLIRHQKLHCIATMRSSDVWLGLPYDVFTFTQIQNVLAGELGVARGSFQLNMGSSHLYERDVPKAFALVNEPLSTARARAIESPSLPGRPPAWLEDVLVAKDLGPIPSSGDRQNDPWLRYAYALVAPSWGAARFELTR